MSPDEVDRDVRRARTLPSRAYTDPGCLDAARERAFVPAWHPVLGVAVPAGAGEFAPWTLLPGFLDEPLLLARADDGELRCLSNVCTHRGNVLVTERGAGRALRCGYHGRCFALDGRMLSMPGFDGVEGFPSPSDDLPRVALERWRDLAFVSLRPDGTLASRLDPVLGRIGAVFPDGVPLDESSVRDFEVAANWALYVDNYLEGLHVPFVHPGLATKLGGYRTETFPLGSLQVGLANEGDPAFELPAGHPDHGERVAAYYVWLFPGTMLNFYPWGLSLNVVTPLAVDRTRVTFASYVARPDLRAGGAGGALDVVEREDERIVERVQLGVRSRLYDRGRFSAEHEACVHHFHRMLESVLAS